MSAPKQPVISYNEFPDDLKRVADEQFAVLQQFCDARGWECKTETVVSAHNSILLVVTPDIRKSNPCFISSFKSWFTSKCSWRPTSDQPYTFDELDKYRFWTSIPYCQGVGIQYVYDWNKAAPTLSDERVAAHWSQCFADREQLPFPVGVDQAGKTGILNVGSLDALVIYGGDTVAQSEFFPWRIAALKNSAGAESATFLSIPPCYSSQNSRTWCTHAQNVLKSIRDEMNIRENLFTYVGADTFNAFNRFSAKKLPRIVLTVKNPERDEKFVQEFRSIIANKPSKYGISILYTDFIPDVNDPLDCELQYMFGDGCDEDPKVGLGVYFASLDGPSARRIFGSPEATYANASYLVYRSHRNNVYGIDLFHEQI